MLSQFLRSPDLVKPAPVIQTMTSATISAGTSTTINKPSGTVDGDLLYFFAGSSSTRADVPAGFTTITSPLGTKRAAYKIASSEPASYTITTPTSQDTTAVMIRISGGSYSASSALGVNATSPITVASASASRSYSLVLMVLCNTSGSVTFTPPNFYTSVYSENATVSASIAVYSLVVPRALVTSQTVTMSGGSGSGFHSVISPI